MFHFRERAQILVSDPISLLATGVTLIAIPEFRKFAVDEVGLIVTHLTGAIATQPTVSFGFVGSNADLLAATLTTQLSAIDKRQRYQTLLDPSVLTTLLMEITVAATGPSVYNARIYFRGILC